MDSGVLRGPTHQAKRAVQRLQHHSMVAHGPTGSSVDSLRSETQARSGGLDIVTAGIVLADAIARPWTYEPELRGELGVIADRSRGVLV